jgi:hypothetical protein
MSEMIRKMKKNIKMGQQFLPVVRCLYATYNAGNNKMLKTTRAVADRPMHAFEGGLGRCELGVDMINWQRLSECRNDLMCSCQRLHGKSQSQPKYLLSIGILHIDNRICLALSEKKACSQNNDPKPQ